jgi:hypothetical protein
MYRDKLLGNDQLKDAFLADVREDVFKGSRQWKVQKKLNEEFVWVGAEFVGEDLPADGKVPLLNFTSSMANSSTKVCSWMSRTPRTKSRSPSARERQNCLCSPTNIRLAPPRRLLGLRLKRVWSFWPHSTIKRCFFPRCTTFARPHLVLGEKGC